MPSERPRGTPWGTPMLERSVVRKDNAVIIRDAFDKEHTAVAATDPQWGRDIVVVWVKLIDGKPGHHVPWPVEDVRCATKAEWAAKGWGLNELNPEPLAATERRDNVTALVAAREMLKARTREDRLRVWLALGGTKEEFDEDYPTDAGEVTDG